MIFSELEVFTQFAFLTQTDTQTESDTYEPTVQLAQEGSIRRDLYSITLFHWEKIVFPSYFL